MAHVSVNDADSDDNGMIVCRLDRREENFSFPFELESMYASEFKLVTREILDREQMNMHKVICIPSKLTILIIHVT